MQGPPRPALFSILVRQGGYRGLGPGSGEQYATYLVLSGLDLLALGLFWLRPVVPS